MKDFLGILGYTFLILGAFFIDTPIIALLFIPVFLAGMIILILFYNKFLKRNNKLGMLGILIICLTPWLFLYRIQSISGSTKS